MSDDNVRPRGRCCDCRNLGIFPDGTAECEGPIPAVYQASLAIAGIKLTPAEVVVIRSCDCYEGRIKPLEVD